MLNVHRLIYRSPEVAWDAVTTHLLAVIRHPLAPTSIRLQAARTLDDILVIVPRNISTTGEMQGQIQERVLNVLSQQVAVGNMVDIRRMGLETLHEILQSSAHTFVTGWEMIFNMLGSVCKPPSLTFARPSISESDLSVISEGATPRRPSFLLEEKANVALVRIAFQSLTLVCDTLSSLSPSHLRLCISTLGLFGKQTDTNIALTAAASLMWSVSDSIQAKRKEAEIEPEYSALWMFLLLEILGLCTDSRHEVRVGAIQTLFRSLLLYGATLSLETWDECIWKVIFPLVDAITTSLRQDTSGMGSSTPGAEQLWDDSKTLALQSLSSVFSDFLTLKIIRLPSFKNVWKTFLSHVEDSFFFDRRSVSTAALRCLERALDALIIVASNTELAASVLDAVDKVWLTCDEMGERISKSTGYVTDVHVQTPRSDSTERSAALLPFTQECLLAYVDVMKKTRDATKAGTLSRDGPDAEGEWPLERLSRLMAILKAVVTYSNSPEYRPDIDALTPVQVSFLLIFSGGIN